MLTLPVRPELLLLPRTLTTSRLTLRCYNEGDGPAFFNAVHASRARLSERLPWVNSNQSVEDSETYVRKMAAHWLLRTDLVFGMWHEENFAGAVGLHSIQWQIPSMMMGWFVCDPFENKGFCTEDAMDASLPTGTDTRLLNADGMSRRLSGRETSSHRGGSSDGYGIKVPMA